MKIGIVSAVRDLYAMGAAFFSSADLSLFHDFEPPPTGGGHQFLRAFLRQVEARGLKIENNQISHTARACLLNSFNFDEKRLGRLKRKSLLCVHRVDGPVDIYRGWNSGVDQHVQDVNKKFADKTIFQSQYSLNRHDELGLYFKNPVVIMNAADPQIFYPQGKIEFSRNRKIRLIASSWSHNINKGTPDYQWLDEHLDWERFEFTFVGNSPVLFKNIRGISPSDSITLSEILREHDIYITASRNDPCSNSLIEALNCGLPAIYLRSGGHPEIVKQAGLGFDSAEEIPNLLDQIVDEYEVFQALISVPTIQTIAEEYLKVLELL